MWQALTPQQRVEEIRAAHAQTIGTASAIAKVLSDKFNKAISRNSVIGFYNRSPDAFRDRPLSGAYSAPKTGKTISQKPQSARPALARTATTRKERPKVAPSPQPVFEMPPAPEALGLRLVDLDVNDCRWPVSGDGAATLFCGHPSTGDSSYCAHHRFRSLGPAGIAQRLAKSR